MASYFNLVLDTTAPSNGSLSMPIRTTTASGVALTIAATDANYMKIYDDFAETAGGTAIAEADASWVAYDTAATVNLAGSDGTKTIYIKFKDDVGNVSDAVSASTVLDTANPLVVVIAPLVTKISKVNGFDVAEFSFSANEAFDEWSVRVVSGTDAGHTAGVEIGSTNGSTNMSGNTSTEADASVSCSINGADLEAASSGDGTKIIKVFVKDLAGNWSN